MKISFLTAAQTELDEEFEFYETQLPGLGPKFLMEVAQALKRIKQYPEAWHPISNRTRRCQLKRFPFGIIYQIRLDMILVVAIAHLHRKPEYWRNRIQSSLNDD